MHQHLLAESRVPRGTPEPYLLLKQGGSLGRSCGPGGLGFLSRSRCPLQSLPPSLGGRARHCSRRGRGHMEPRATHVTGAPGTSGALAEKGRSSLNERANSRCPEAWPPPPAPAHPGSLPHHPPRQESRGFHGVLCRAQAWVRCACRPLPGAHLHPPAWPTLTPRTSRDGLLLAASPPAPQLTARKSASPTQCFFKDFCLRTRE